METSSKLNPTLFIRGILMTEVIWKDPQTGKVWKRIGECNRCGGCCTTLCPFFKLVALRDIKKNEEIKEIGISGGALMAVCEVFDKDIEVSKSGFRCDLKARQRFPSDPLHTPEGCSFKWIDEEGNLWRRDLHDYRLGKLRK